MNITMEQWMGLFRHAMGTLGMYLVMMGMVEAAMWEQVVGGVMTIVPFIWSYMVKK